jgi:IS5 family transposase
MPKQMVFASLARATRKKVTRRETLLTKMEAVVPWPRLPALIEPHDPKMGVKGGRPAMALELMLRIHCLQQRYALSDPLAEESLYDSDAMRRFAGLELGETVFLTKRRSYTSVIFWNVTR